MHFLPNLKNRFVKTIPWLIFIILVIVLSVILVNRPHDRMVYTVVEVIDGDTIDVDVNGTIGRVRLIGIDAPETVDPRQEVQCFGPEASAKAKEMLTNVKVRLEYDLTQGYSDAYGRMLRYVWLPDGTNFNQWMIEQGLVREYTYQDQSYVYQEEFKQAEAKAKADQVGLWAEDACE